MNILSDNFEETESLNKIFIEELFDKANISDENKEIFVLRYGHNWYYKEIGEYIGNKYRGKPYVEGTIRYRLKQTYDTLSQFLDT